jgi:hypothetical protein
VCILTSFYTISDVVQYVASDSKIYCKKIKMCKCISWGKPTTNLLQKSVAQEIGFSVPNSCSLPWLVKRATPKNWV